MLPTLIASLHPILPAGPRPSQELATETEEVKEKVCRLNQEVGWGWFLPPTLGYHFGIRDMPHTKAFQDLESESWMTLGKPHDHSDFLFPHLKMREIIRSTLSCCEDAMRAHTCPAHSWAQSKYSVTSASPLSQLAQVVQPAKRASPPCTTVGYSAWNGPQPSHNAPGLSLIPALGNEC